MINRILETDKNISNKLLVDPEQWILKGILSFLAHTGDSWYIEILLFIIWLLSSGTTHTFVAYLAGSVIIQALIVIAIKFMIKRQRPAGNWGRMYRQTDPHSFPSGHAARAIMLSVISFGFNLPVLGIILLIWGMMLSLARVALGVHFLIDIIAGWIIGVLLGFMMLGFRPFFYEIFPFVF